MHRQDARVEFEVNARAAVFVHGLHVELPIRLLRVVFPRDRAARN